MIKFLTDKTVSMIRYGQGSIVNLPSHIEKGLIEEGAATIIPMVTRPVEVLANSATPVPCATTAVDEILASFTIPAGTLGPNSILQIEPLWTFASNANAKVLKVKIAGVTVYAGTRTTSTREAPLIVIANRNSMGSQIMPYENSYVTQGSGTPAIFALDFSANLTIEITGSRVNAGDATVLQYYRILHFIGG